MFRKYTNSFLKDFNTDEIISKFSHKEVLTFERGCFIFSENEPASNIYFILSGKIEIRKTSNSLIGTICCIGPGDLIGLEDALTAERYCYSAYVIKDAETISVKRENFLNAMKLNDEFNLWILKYLSCRISSLG